jgi:hypothetical protein
VSVTTVAAYTIGQTPRPDLIEDLTVRFDSVRFEIVGVLDDLTKDQIPNCGPNGYPLETRLRDGARVVVDSAFLEPLLQRAINGLDESVAVHLVLCAGAFPSLTAQKTLIQPFQVAVTELAGRGLKSLEVIVPFREQERPALQKWEASGFSCRTHVLGDQPDDLSVTRWLSGRLHATSADALVFDYVGFPAAIADEVAAEIDMPVFDLGHLAMNALEGKLTAL